MNKSISLIVFASLMLLGASIFSSSNTYGEIINHHGHPSTLKEQLADYGPGKKLICPNPDHVLVLRPDMKWACVYHDTAQYLKWDVVSFLEFGAKKITTQVFRDNEYHSVSYQLTDGHVDSLEFNTEMSALLAQLTTAVKGEITFTISTGENGLFRDYCHEVDAIPDTEEVMVLRDGKEAEFESSEINTDLINITLDYLDDTKLIEIFYVCWV